jgi:hypothetical protein
MKKFALIIAMIISSAATYAQSNVFKGVLDNKEFNVFLNIDFYNQNVKVPGQEIYGNLPGYLGTNKSNYVWLITSAKIIDSTKSEISLINDYGSEDLKCTLSLNQDSTFTLKQEEGATLKIVANRKYVKIPKTIILKKRATL